MELTHDTICAYVSSKDEDRMRPLCTLLCETWSPYSSLGVINNLTSVAFVQGVLPVDPKRPRILRLILDPVARTANDYAEFDTEESAQDWRREVTGMWHFLFLVSVI